MEIVPDSLIFWSVPAACAAIGGSRNAINNADRLVLLIRRIRVLSMAGFSLTNL